MRRCRGRGRSTRTRLARSHRDRDRERSGRESRLCLPDPAHAAWGADRSDAARPGRPRRVASPPVAQVHVGRLPGAGVRGQAGADLGPAPTAEERGGPLQRLAVSHLQRHRGLQLPRDHAGPRAGSWCANRPPRAPDHAAEHGARARLARAAPQHRALRRPAPRHDPRSARPGDRHTPQARALQLVRGAPHPARSANDDRDLLLPGLGLVVLAPLRTALDAGDGRPSGDARELRRRRPWRPRTGALCGQALG
jgi:hypothetical protein